MADWVHCNKCFRLPGSGKRFLLTSCGHIYCSDCINVGVPMNCQICGNSCTTIQLSSQMKPDVEVYFTDTQELLKKSLKQLQQVISFQNGHRIRLAAYHKQQMTQVGKMKEEMKASSKFLKDLERERTKLKEENLYLRQTLHKQDRSNKCENYQINLQPNPHRPTPPNRITVRTPPVNGHIGVIPRTLQFLGTPPTPATSERSMLSITPTNLTPTTPKIGSEGKAHSFSRFSPYSSQMSVSNSHSREISPKSSSTSYYSGSPNSNSLSSKLSASFHRPIQLRQELRHPGLIRKAKISPYSPSDRNEELRIEE